MSYTVSPGSIFGRVGESLGRALSEQIPKEVERSRLARGLQDLANQPNLNPFQMLAGVAGLPGATPQLIQTTGELAKLQAQGQALKDFGKEERPISFPIQPTGSETGRALSQFATISKPEDLEKAIEGYIPPTQQDIYSSAAQLYNKNPAMFRYDPNLAIQAAEQAASRDEAIVSAHKARVKETRGIEQGIKESLRLHSKELRAEEKVPPNLYSKIESDAINSIKPKSQGGEGLTEEQATKKYGLQLDAAARDYADLSSVGNTRKILSNRPSTTETQISSLQKDFAKRDDLENFALSLVADHGLSEPVAYSKAFPIENNEKIYHILKTIPDNFKEREIKVTPQEEEKIFASILKNLNEEDSPLAIAQALMNKSYDPTAWLSYVKKNGKGLSARQNRELNKQIPLFYTLNDLWLFPNLK